MRRLNIDEDAVADLDDLWEYDEAAAADIEVLLAEIEAAPAMLQALFIHQARQGRIHVSRLLHYHIWGRSMWRIKIREITDEAAVLPYRIIYATLGDVAHVVAIMHRDTDYERDDQLVSRIKNACRRLGIGG
jgi:hypothetical protein